MNESDFQHTTATLSFHPILPVPNLVSYIHKSIIIKIVSDLKNDNTSYKCRTLQLLITTEWDHFCLFTPANLKPPALQQIHPVLMWLFNLKMNFSQKAKRNFKKKGKLVRRPELEFKRDDRHFYHLL